jgi:hypothetical protein
MREAVIVSFGARRLVVHSGGLQSDLVSSGEFEFDNASELAAADAIFGCQAEEALDLVEPGRRSGRHVHVDSVAARYSLARLTNLIASSCLTKN